MNEAAFWMIYSPQGSPPVYRHMSIDDAKREAERLALQNPGKEFYVLRAVGKCQHKNVQWTKVGECGAAEDDIPF